MRTEDTNEAEARLRESEERFRALFETMTQGVVYQNAQGEVISANPAAERILGLTLDQMQGRTERDPGWRAVHEDGSDFPSEWHPAMEALRTAQPVRNVVIGVYVPAEAQYHWSNASAVPQFEPGATTPYHVCTTYEDITERKHLESLVRAQRDLARSIGKFDSLEAGFRAILDTVLRLSGMDSGGIYLFSPDGQRLELIYHQGLGAAFVRAVNSYPRDSINARMILAGAPYYLTYDDPPAQTPIFLAERLRSLAAIPILYHDRVIGCFNLASHTEHEVRHFARQALETLAVEVGNFVVQLQSQAALRASEEKFRQIADTINEVFWIFDNEQQRLIYLNPTYERVWGISIEDTYRDNRKYIEAIHPDDRPIMFGALARQGRGEQTEMEYRVVRPDGTVRWIFDRSFPILGDDGRVLRTTGVATDITALKHNQHEQQELNHALEERVRQRTAELQDLYDNAPIGYHSVDANGCLLRVNQTELNWLGYIREEVIGRSVMEFVTEAGRSTLVAYRDALKQRGFVRDLEYDLVRKDGTTFPVLANATAIYDRQGTFVASRSTLVDNTERKRAELALRESEETLRFANAELARALRLKDEFLASMSHELRTPLHGILAMSEMLLDQVRGPLNERQQKSVRLIEESGRHLLALINDLLDLSKIEAGKLELHFAAAAVDDICRASLLFVREMAAKKEIQVEYANAVPGAQITADAQRLKQMLVNLLINAVKFTPSGGHVRLSIAADPGAGLIHFGVQDDGPGIAPADQGRLFQPFIQIDAQLSREHEGTGLGLALVKRLAEQHGGSVQLHSSGVPGEGACFTITLPHEQQSA